jgi:hypothetical protein
MAGHCLSTVKLCAIRVTALDGSCGCTETVIATSAAIRVASNPMKTSPGEHSHRSTQSSVTLLMQEKPTVTAIQLEVELCTRDLELVALVTGGTVYRNGDDVAIGVAHRSTVNVPPPVSVEIWSRNVNGVTGFCTVEGVPSYTRVVWPLARFVVQDDEYANGVATVRLAGVAWANHSYPIDGCWEDSTVELDPLSPEHQFYDAVLPTLGAHCI